MRKLTNLEFEILSMLFRERYGYELVKLYQKHSGSQLLLGTLYKALARLEEDGMVKSRMGEPTEERGGAQRRYYKIDGSGEVAYNEHVAIRNRFQKLAKADAKA